MKRKIETWEMWILVSEPATTLMPGRSAGPCSGSSACLISPLIVRKPAPRLDAPPAAEP